MGAFCVTCTCYCRLFLVVTCLFFLSQVYDWSKHTHTNGVSDPVVTWTSGGSSISYFSCLCAVNMFCEPLLSIRECASLQPATVRHWTKPLRHWTAPGRFCLKAVMTMKITQCDEHGLSVLLHLLWCLIIYDLPEKQNKKEIPLRTWYFNKKKTTKLISCFEYLSLYILQQFTCTHVHTLMLENCYTLVS